MARKFLFLFMDGLGLGANDPDLNPLALAEMPNLQALLDGRKLLVEAAPLTNQRATLLALDAGLGVPGLPQSATGQATLVTGKNIPQLIGEHYGPKPNQPIRQLIAQGTLFSQLHQRGLRTTLLNAYPEGYFQAIESGKRLYSAIPLAVTEAGLPLKTTQDLKNGRAFSADFTGQGWRQHLGYEDIPLLGTHQAGEHLAALAASYDFAFFEYWISDFAGHRQDKSEAVKLMETFDQVLGGLLHAWDHQNGLIFITSDHGNIEDLSTRRHTLNPVPGLMIGAAHLREAFSADLHDLTGVAPAILRMYDL